MRNRSNIPLVLKYPDWPSSDRASWDDLFRNGEIFDDEGRCVHWSAGTRTKRKQDYGQWLSFLKRTTPDTLHQPPADRVSQYHVRAFINEAAGRVSPRSVYNLVLDICVVISCFAPERDWRWLSKISNRLLAASKQHTHPKRELITASELFDWSLKRMNDVEELNTHTPLKRAIWFRQALMIGLLIARPVRRRAFIGIHIGIQLVEMDEGFMLKFRPEDMKDKRQHNYITPKDLNKYLCRYLDVHRSVLLQGKCTLDQSIWQCDNRRRLLTRTS